MPDEISLETLRSQLADDEIIMGKNIIGWSRETKEFVQKLVDSYYPMATTAPDKFGAAVASIGMLIMVDAVVTTVTEEERYQTFLAIAKDMATYITNGVDLSKFTVPDDVKDM